MKGNDTSFSSNPGCTRRRSSISLLDLYTYSIHCLQYHSSVLNNGGKEIQRVCAGVEPCQHSNYKHLWVRWGFGSSEVWAPLLKQVDARIHVCLDRFEHLFCIVAPIGLDVHTWSIGLCGLDLSSKFAPSSSPRVLYTVWEHKTPFSGLGRSPPGLQRVISSPPPFSIMIPLMPSRRHLGLLLWLEAPI